MIPASHQNTVIFFFIFHRRRTDLNKWLILLTKDIISTKKNGRTKNLLSVWLTKDISSTKRIFRWNNFLLSDTFLDKLHPKKRNQQRKKIENIFETDRNNIISCCLLCLWREPRYSKSETNNLNGLKFERADEKPNQQTFEEYT